MSDQALVPVQKSQRPVRLKARPRTIPPLIARGGIAAIRLGTVHTPRKGFLAHRVLYRDGRRDELTLCGARTGEMVAAIEPDAPLCSRCDLVEAR